MKPMTKAQLNQLLVAERQKAREKQKQSAFMRRTLSIYHGQKKRMEQAYPDGGVCLPYSLEELRQAMRAALDRGQCEYCRQPLKVRTITPDHRIAIVGGGNWQLSNLAFVCQPCNWQKGRLSSGEFLALLTFCERRLSPASATDLKRRLSIGGRWSPK